jgi:6,7-dimethyl-8-ribityllumazine synthase
LKFPASSRSRKQGAKPYDAYVGLGCVIRGETSHYDYVCGESARGLMDLSLKGVCLGYGILTVENIRQARVRAHVDQKNKGKDAAEAALSMLALKRKFGAA